jgi:Transposase and inactivated derivatives, TnpA family
LPRIKGINHKKLHPCYSNHKEKYPHLEKIISTPIKWDLIREQYDEIVKYTAALKKGTAETDVLLKRFSKGNYEHPTYKALMELGKAVKTIFLCKYLSDEELRIEINASLNIVERVNALTHYLFFGKLGVLSTNNPEDQELSILSLQLLQVCLVYINTLLIQDVLEDKNWVNKFTKEDWRALSPLMHKHINPYGKFPLDMKEAININRPKENLNDLYQNAA